MLKSTLIGFSIGFVLTVTIAFLWLYISLTPAEIELKELELVDTSGNEVVLNDFRGENVFLNFWNTSCKPCLEEFHTIEIAKDSLVNYNIVFVMVSDNEVQEIIDFQKKYNYSFKFMKSKKKLRDLGIYAIPTTYFINGQGEIILSQTGMQDWSTGINYNNLKNLVTYYK